MLSTVFGPVQLIRAYALQGRGFRAFRSVAGAEAELRAFFAERWRNGFLANGAAVWQALRRLREHSLAIDSVRIARPFRTTDYTEYTDS